MSTAVTYSATPSAPRVKLPAGSCDTHCHVFGPQAVFPYPADARFKPADAPKEQLFALHDMLGIETCVIVQSGAHGFDNRATADAIAARAGRYKGVALMPHDAPLSDLKALTAQGFCGVRFNFMSHLARSATPSELVAMGGRLAEIGWHLQVHFEAGLIDELIPVLKESPVPVVIDHMARIDAGLGLGQPAYQSLLRAMEDELFWLKVSGCDRASRTGPPYSDAMELARDLVARFPDRVLWGTDWPHPNHQGPIPDDGILVDLIAEIAPSEAAMQKLMVTNPHRFYGFKAR